MKIEQALSQISEIHFHLTRSSYYKGYRSLPVAYSGIIGLSAAWLQPMFIGASSPKEFVIYWSFVAMVASLPAGTGIVFRYVFLSDRNERRKTETVIGQSLPALVAGMIITVGLYFSGSNEAMVFLPALWAFCYGLGAFASRPFLPRMIGWGGLYYFIAGCFLLRLGAKGILSAWGMGLTFGIGQLLAAAILYLSLERRPR